MHKNGDRVPGRADDHEDRRFRARRRSPATCATSPTASRPRRSCARRARASSRSPTPSGGGSSATSTTARSSGSRRCCSPSAGCARDAAASATRCSTSRSTSSRRASRRSASSRAACTRRCSRSAGSSPALEALALRAPVPVELAARARPAGCRSRSRPPRTTSSPRRSRTSRSTPARTGRRPGATDERRAARRGRRRRRRRGGSEGDGLRGLADRVEALGGTLEVDSPAGRRHARRRAPARRLTTLDGRAPPTRSLDTQAATAIRDLNRVSYSAEAPSPEDAHETRIDEARDLCDRCRLAARRGRGCGGDGEHGHARRRGREHGEGRIHLLAHGRARRASAPRSSRASSSGSRISRARTNTCGGHKLAVTYVDDQTNPANAVTAAKDLIGQGYKIIAGSTSSGVGAAGRADRRPEQHPVHLRAGRGRRDHRAQPVHVPRRPAELPGRPDRGEHPAAEVRRQEGRRLRARTRRSAQGNFAAGQAGHRRQGPHGLEDPRPVPATDFTPFAQQVKNANADLVFVAWAGTNAAAMWQALDQQDVLDTTTVITGLAERVQLPDVRADRRPEGEAALALRLPGRRRTR